jgi:hypothetical protein
MSEMTRGQSDDLARFGRFDAEATERHWRELVSPFDRTLRSARPGHPGRQPGRTRPSPWPAVFTVEP